MKSIMFLSLCFLVLNGCEIDNYMEPELTLTGKIVDAQSGMLVESGGSNGGTIVKFYQGGSAQALLFKTKPDGTFMNSRMFSGDYRYVAEGPFEIIRDTPTIHINGNVDIEIKVTPNIRLSSSISGTSGNEAVINVNYHKVSADAMTKLGIVWSDVTAPNIFTFIGGNIVTRDVQGMDLTDGDENFTISGLKTGRKYYIRAFAVTNSPGNYYNYSTQIELQK